MKKELLEIRVNEFLRMIRVERADIYSLRNMLLLRNSNLSVTQLKEEINFFFERQCSIKVSSLLYASFYLVMQLDDYDAFLVKMDGRFYTLIKLNSVDYFIVDLLAEKPINALKRCSFAKLLNSETRIFNLDSDEEVRDLLASL